MKEGFKKNFFHWKVGIDKSLKTDDGWLTIKCDKEK